MAPNLDIKSGQEPGEGQALCPALGGSEGVRDALPLGEGGGVTQLGSLATAGSWVQ